MTKKGCKSAFLKEYEVLSVNHKWIINKVWSEEQATRRASAIHLTPLRARLEMVAEAARTCANTNKSLSVKKARMIKQELVGAKKEIEIEEKKMYVWAENFAGGKEAGLAAVMAAAHRTAANAPRTDALSITEDDNMLLKDTSRMSRPVLAVYLAGKKLAMHMMLHRCHIADRVMAIATTAATNEFAATTVAKTVASTATAVAFIAAAELVEIVAAAKVSCVEEGVTNFFGHANSDKVSPPRDESGNGGDENIE